jgi:hypothetical protein
VQASGSDLSHLSAGWIALVVSCNDVLAAGDYCAWHYRLFGRPTASNAIWTLGSGVPIWSANLVFAP